MNTMDTIIALLNLTAAVTNLILFIGIRRRELRRDRLEYDELRRIISKPEFIMPLDKLKTLFDVKSRSPRKG